ncbi:aminoglycoside phosphotransferase family protein [Streptomyces meridianus]|uniref:Aminoglycoside phosphotransferase family protein n=1 Tax=Streptomyces meridianus TaxID=2938945 RepID=A0ABT0X4H3_9ACTN|nr:aminoglycoside phosphotransferase family protein [Streptomyces meridianus]MCM2577319.1 aminoglycoside phosphotransferase family protein [Streptomyces meridianus]
MTTDIDRIVARLGARLVGGPLGGFHNRVFAIDLPATNCPDGPLRRLKLFTARPGVVWFDLRFFPSQDELLDCIDGLVPRIPEVVRIPGFRLHRFIEGRPLGALSGGGCPLEGHHLFQLTELFGRLSAVPLDALPVRRREHLVSWPRDGDSAGFLRRLIDFAQREVYTPHEKDYGCLFSALGVPEGALPRIAEAAHRMTPRPFVLLHGDLHRENLIVDCQGELWTIDWELAMIGDPLYDLATHLHLMRYPAAQQAVMIESWRRTIERSRPGASAGMVPDLGHYLAYKRIQSVYTDLLREARKLRDEGTSPTRTTCRRVGVRVHGVLARAQHVLGLTRIPSVRRIVTVYADWLRTAQPPGQESAYRTSGLAVTPCRGPSTCPGR